jgi:predicted acylesterase/phospholipase RssA
MLTHLLSQETYALSLTPGFFRFYAEIGILEALEEADCLKVSHVTGSSAGALVGAFVAAGSTCTEMTEQVLAIQRTDVWDVGGIGGLLKGEKFLHLVEQFLPKTTFEECAIPAAFTTFDLLGMKTRILTSGSLALAARASCTFPGLFQPAIVEGNPCIDGGVWDHVGLMGLEECFKVSNNKRAAQGEPEEDFTNKLIVNVVFSTPRGSVLPKSLSKCRVSLLLFLPNETFLMSLFLRSC